MGNDRKKCLAFPEGSIGQMLKFNLETGKRILILELRGRRRTGKGRGLSGNITAYPVSVCIYVVWLVCGLVCMAHGTWGEVYGVWFVAWGVWCMVWTCCVSMLEAFKGFGRIQGTENAEDGQMS